MSIYNVNKNYQAGIFPETNTRGAYSFAPVEGSSNIQIAGRYAAPIQATAEGLGEGSIFNNPEFKKLSDKDKELYMRTYGPSPDSRLIDRFTSPEYMAQQEAIQDRALQKGLAAYKQMGDQQMKYSLINRGLSGLSEGIRSALTRYPDPYMTANLTTGVAAAASRGAEAARGFTQLGAGNAPIKYFNV
jgi:hypothetical protein